jgi:hypothetical protein
MTPFDQTLLTPADLTGAADSVFEWIWRILGSTRRISPQEAAGIQALMAAIQGTQTYLTDFKARNLADPIKEYDLAQHWFNAGRVLNQVDPSLGVLCTIKGKAWADYTQWSDEEVRFAGARLVDLKNGLSALAQRGE